MARHLLPLIALAACGADAPAPHCAGAERFDVVTTDGAAVTLHRHPPVVAVDPSAPPVLIVHGISSNHHCWDLAPDRSLGVFLAEAGVDAWLLDLRGHGDATRDARGHAQRSGWAIDEYGLHDLPAAVAFIQQQTGAPQIAYVGHSLGGMVGAIYAGSVPGGDEALSSLVAVGSPMDFSDPDPLVGVALKLADASGPVMPVIQSALGADLYAGLKSNPLKIDDMLFNDLADVKTRAMMYRRVVSPMTGGELRQIGRLKAGGAFVSLDGERDYLAGLAQVQTPTLVIAGRVDNIAPVDRVLSYYESVGADQKRFVVAGRSTGFAADYGHLDLTLGDHARDEIFPLILDWIRR
jgi:pimeloyl-ACP methyl ester carboxylesterase